MRAKIYSLQFFHCQFQLPVEVRKNDALFCNVLLAIPSERLHLLESTAWPLLARQWVAWSKTSVKAGALTNAYSQSISSMAFTISGMTPNSILDTIIKYGTSITSVLPAKAVIIIACARLVHLT